MDRRRSAVSADVDPRDVELEYHVVERRMVTYRVAPPRF